MIHLATGLAVREDGRVLLVASRYASHPQPLWGLPGGRQQHRELLAETVVREVFEETGLRARTTGLAYVSESYDGDEHFLNATFRIGVSFDSAQDDISFDFAQDDTRGAGDHVVAVEWVCFDELASRIAVAVVREPLLAYLRGELAQRYAGYHEAGVTIRWPNDSR